MKQRWLPEFDYPDVEQPREEADSPDGGQSGAPESAGVLPGQTELFTAERELIGQIEAALGAGRFEDARLYRDALTVVEGTSAGLADLAALDLIGEARFWDRALPAVLSDWLTLDQTLKTLPNLGRLMRNGGLSRLTERYTEFYKSAGLAVDAITPRAGSMSPSSRAL